MNNVITSAEEGAISNAFQSVLGFIIDEDDILWVLD